jgi:transcriptional regulator with XRE-family HTH domain
MFEDLLFQQRLRQLILDRFGSLTAFYRETGFSKGHLSQILRGKRTPSLATMIRLARTLGVEVGDFFSRQSDSAAETKTPHEVSGSHEPEPPPHGGPSTSTGHPLPRTRRRGPRARPRIREHRFRAVAPADGSAPGLAIVAAG